MLSHDTLFRGINNKINCPVSLAISLTMRHNIFSIPMNIPVKKKEGKSHSFAPSVNFSKVPYEVHVALD